MKIILIFIFIPFFIISAKESFLLMSYNVEHLFDNIDNPNTIDEKFLPTSNPPYTNDQVQKKIDHIASVILSESTNSYFKHGPDIVALVEVENLHILERLAITLNSRLKFKPHYRAIFIPGDDVSGINPGLLTKFPVNFTQTHIVHKDDLIWLIPGVSSELGIPTYTKTRSILEVSLLIEKSPLTIFVNHWPAGNKSHNVLRRYFCATFLKDLISERLELDSNLDIIVTGDFNAQPEDASMLAGLSVDESLERVMSSSEQNPSLYGTSYEIFNKSKIKKIFYMEMNKFKKNKLEKNIWDKKYIINLEKYFHESSSMINIVKNFINENKIYNDRNFSKLQNILIENIFKKRGTFFYWPDMEWTNLDSINLTKTLFDNKNINYNQNSYKIVRPEFITFENGKPLAFHKCKRFKGSGECMKNENGIIIHQEGYSDHFPVTSSFSIIN